MAEAILALSKDIGFEFERMGAPTMQALKHDDKRWELVLGNQLCDSNNLDCDFDLPKRHNSPLQIVIAEQECEVLYRQTRVSPATPAGGGLRHGPAEGSSKVVGSAAGFRQRSAIVLTERECAILQLLSRGFSNKEAARSLDISPETVKSHVKNIFQKLCVDRRAQAVCRAFGLGIITSG